jgi:hypothetical protein
MRVAFAMIALLALAACETPANEGGVANYDALKQASQQCQANGGHLVLKPGGDNENIQDYACEKGK